MGFSVSGELEGRAVGVGLAAWRWVRGLFCVFAAPAVVCGSSGIGPHVPNATVVFLSKHKARH